jgi:hypothetical protein
MYLLSLLPAMKKLSPLDNLDFSVEVQETLHRYGETPKGELLGLVQIVLS